MNDYEYLKDEQKKLESLSEVHRQDTNRFILELSKHLILTSTVFIALASSIFAFQDYDQKIVETGYGKLILLLSFASLILSVFFGLCQFFIDQKFFSKWAEKYSEWAKAISGKKFKTIHVFEKYVEDEQEKNKLKSKSASWPVKTQSSMLFLGVAGVTGIVIYIFLF